MNSFTSLHLNIAYDQLPQKKMRSWFLYQWFSTEGLPRETYDMGQDRSQGYNFRQSFQQNAEIQWFAPVREVFMNVKGLELSL